MRSDCADRQHHVRLRCDEGVRRGCRWCFDAKVEEKPEKNSVNGTPNARASLLILSSAGLRSPRSIPPT